MPSAVESSASSTGGGRLYDPKLSRLLTPDPIVAKPAFGQSWNPYSYVLNGPLSHVDPSGFTEEPADAVVSPGGFLIIPEPSDEPYVDMVWQVFAVGTESEEPSEAPDSGAAVVPQDANTWGNNAGWLPQPSATAQELPRQNSVGLEIYIGVTQGTAELALDAAKSLVLNALTFGGYGTWQFGKAMWAGYHEKNGGFIGALKAVNPLYQIARGGADSYMAAERGALARQGQRRSRASCSKRRSSSAAYSLADATSAFSSLRSANILRTMASSYSAKRVTTWLASEELRPSSSRATRAASRLPAKFSRMTTLMPCARRA